MSRPEPISRIGPPWWNSHWSVLAALALGVVAGVVLNLLGGGGDPAGQPAPGGVAGTAMTLVAVCDAIADIFLRLLTMLVAPLVLFSIMAGLANIVDTRTLGRLGLRTLAYYVGTSLLAILTGLLLVNLIRPGTGAELNLQKDPGQLVGDAGDLWGIFTRLVPQNVFHALATMDMLQIITFALLAGIAMTRLPGVTRERVSTFVQAAFELMTSLASLVLSLLPIAVFALVARVAARSAGEEIRPLLLFMLTVALGLGIHALVTLPLILRTLTGASPTSWVRAVSPALVTAFSTSSSSATLPVTIEVVEDRGRVPNRIASFVLPLGATVNMDGTALYECVGAIFLAQFYATALGFQLTATHQLIVVGTALLASIGAAGIPSAGLVMMTIILRALELPVEGALLFLAIDRTLDMMRTSVNVWSDTVGSAVIGTLEGCPPDPSSDPA
jgi:Na+/H+-dicarboxylate symporter